MKTGKGKDFQTATVTTPPTILTAAKPITNTQKAIGPGGRWLFSFE